MYRQAFDNTSQFLREQSPCWLLYGALYLGADWILLLGNRLTERQPGSALPLMIVGTVMMFWVQASLILHILTDSKTQSLLNGLYATPRYILYNIFLMLQILAGVILLVIPGVYIAVVHAFAPPLAIHQPDAAAFGWSRKLVKGHFWPLLGILLPATLLLPHLSTMAAMGGAPEVLQMALLPANALGFIAAQSFLTFFLKKRLANAT